MPLFQVEDFELFERYGGVAKDDAPEGFGLLRDFYDKLKLLCEEIKERSNHRYSFNINRNPTIRGIKYWDYHWAQLYLHDSQSFRDACHDKVFFVIGTTESGFNCHIDFRVTNWELNSIETEVSKEIKESSWTSLSPEEVSAMKTAEIADYVIHYMDRHLRDFYRYGGEFGITECSDRLNRLKMQSYIDLLTANRNLVLTGAPGTGKTYLARQIASRMILGKTDIDNLTDAEQSLLLHCCRMVQFHPSMDYTDFVEGLRPTPPDANGNIGFRRADGIFKQFCAEAIDTVGSEAEILYALEVFKSEMDGKRIPSVRTDIEFGIKIKDDNIFFIPGSHLDKAEPNLYFADIPAVIKYILTGSYDGTHKSYEPALGDYLKNNYLKPHPFIFIIDEINRGEIAKIFGELFFAIDPGYRGKKGKVTTQYQNLITDDDDPFRDGFYVPENVFILGTMNDIDRSVDTMDFAIRRRFAWQEVTAASSSGMLDSLDANVRDSARRRMQKLNDAIGSHRALGSAFHIGASYFLKLGNYLAAHSEDEAFDLLWEHHLHGLLAEYLRGTPDAAASLESLKTAYQE